MPRPLRSSQFGGKSPQEFWALHSFPPSARCAACRALPSVRAILMAPYDEAVKRGLVPPGHQAGPEVLERTVMLRRGDGTPEPHVRLSVTYSCRACQRAFERELARAPSWCVVDLNHGPNPQELVQAQV